MKVLFITRKFPPSVGGMELFARDLSEALAAKTELKLVKWGRRGRLLAVVVGLPYLFLRSFVVMLGGRIDVVHAQDTVVAPAAYVLSRLFRKPLIVVVHGLDITYQNPLFRAVVPAVVRRADAVVCISQAAAESARAAGVDPIKLHVVPLAVNDKIFQTASRDDLAKQLNLPDDSQVLLTVGRLVKRKGVEWFIGNVLPALAGQFPNLVYLVAGTGPERENIEAAAARNHIYKNVRLLGKTSPELLAAAYNGADVFVMPNIKVPGDMEGFGLVLLEAALCERPIVASALEGIEEAVANGANGVLVPPGDAMSFQKQMEIFLKDRQQAEQFGRKSRQYTLAKYQNENVARQYLEIYEACNR